MFSSAEWPRRMADVHPSGQVEFLIPFTPSNQMLKLSPRSHPSCFPPSFSASALSSSLPSSMYEIYPTMYPFLLLNDALVSAVASFTLTTCHNSLPAGTPLPPLCLYSPVFTRKTDYSSQTTNWINWFSAWASEVCTLACKVLRYLVPAKPFLLISYYYASPCWAPPRTEPLEFFSILGHNRFISISESFVYFLCCHIFPQLIPFCLSHVCSNVTSSEKSHPQ